MKDVDAYIARVQYELGEAVGMAVKQQDTRLAWQFASNHKALLIGTVVPLTIVFRSPQAAMFAMRGMGVVYTFSRILPPGVQWRLFSRMWVGAILYLEKVGTKAVEAASRPTKKP